MMPTVAADHVAEGVSKGQGLAKKLELAVQVGRGELFDAGDSVVVNTVIPGRECFHLAGTLHIRWFHVDPELALLNSETHVSVAFGQMPGQLTERAATLIRTKIVLGCGERSQELQRILSFAIPGFEEPFEFIDRHAISPLSI